MADTKTLVIWKINCRNFYCLFRFLISHVTREKANLTYNIIWDCRSNKIQARTKLAKSEWFISFYSYMKQHLSLLPFILPFYIFIPRSEIQPYQQNMFTIYQGFLQTLLITLLLMIALFWSIVYLLHNSRVICYTINRYKIYHMGLLRLWCRLKRRLEYVICITIIR